MKIHILSILLFTSFGLKLKGSAVNDSTVVKIYALCKLNPKKYDFIIAPSDFYFGSAMYINNEKPTEFTDYSGYLDFHIFGSEKSGTNTTNSINITFKPGDNYIILIVKNRKKLTCKKISKSRYLNIKNALNITKEVTE